jgi:hypothetical protein
MPDIATEERVLRVEICTVGTTPAGVVSWMTGAAGASAAVAAAGVSSAGAAWASEVQIAATARAIRVGRYTVVGFIVGLRSGRFKMVRRLAFQHDCLITIT